MANRNIQRNPRQQNKKFGGRKQSKWVRTELLRLTVAVLIFAACFLGKSCIPSVQQQLSPILQNLLSCSCDFEEAVRCFSTQLEQGDDVGDALEDFCVTAFAVQTNQEGPAVNADQIVLRNAISYPGTLARGY